MIALLAKLVRKNDGNGTFATGWSDPVTISRVYRGIPSAWFKDVVVLTNRPVCGEDFRDFGMCNALAALGFFAVDLEAHRAKRAQQRATRELIEEAYDVVGLDRNREHSRIASEMEASLTSGIWARSTGEYARRCSERDNEMLERSPAILETLNEVGAPDLTWGTTSG